MAIVIVTPDVSRIAVLTAGRRTPGSSRTHRRRLPGRSVPGGFEVLPQERFAQVLGAFAAEPWHRQVARVVQRARTRRRTSLREDEPHHPMRNERSTPALYMPPGSHDHGAEPAVEHEQNGGESSQKMKGARLTPFSNAQREHRDEQRDGAMMATCCRAGCSTSRVVRGLSVSHGVCLLLR